MSVQLRTGPDSIASRMRTVSFAAASAAVMLAGCSASITRFDNPSFALGEGSGTGAKRTGSGPSLEAPPRAASTYQDAPPRAASAVEVAPLPAIQERPAPAVASVNAPPAKAMAVTRQTPAPAAAPVASVARGEQIEVQPGDTLYAIGKRHKVLISDLMAVNELRNPNIKPGQKLYLPGADGRAPPKVKPERTASLSPQAVTPTAVAAPAVAAADGGQTYVVKPGDSLYAIAARHKIKVLDLQRANGITDVGKVKPGTILKLPAGHGVAVVAAAASHTGETMQPEDRIVRVGAAGSSTGQAATGGVRLLNGSDSVASASATGSGPAAVVASPSATASAKPAKLRWPVRGRVVQGFGPRGDGTHNDGLDIAVPAGTDVLAAEDGVISYAGSEVKVYGNLVLVRHDNGWVTAYANNDKLLVQRGDQVKRGQAIAKAGKSGGADQPQVHFEVRVGAKPVDPVAYLESP